MLILVVILGIAVIIAIGFLFVKKCNVIWEQGTGKIKAIYGDISQGSVLPVEGSKGLTYYLLALSEFDENLNAQCSKENFVSCIQSLISFYDRNGQGNPIYLPLMGTGLSRVNLSQEESLSIIVNMLKLNRDKIHGEVSVVVFSKEKSLVSIHILIGDTNSKKGFSRVSKCQLRGHVTGGLGSPVVSVNNPSNDYENAAYSLTQAT